MVHTYNPHRRFMWLLGGLTVAGMIILSLIVSFLFDRNVMNETEQVTKEAVGVHFRAVFPSVFGKTMTQTGGGYGDSTQPPKNYQQLKTVVSMHFDLYNILDTRFFDRNGRIYFSYDRDEIGEVREIQGPLKKAFHGDAAIQELQGAQLEMWIPIKGQDGSIREVAYIKRDISTQVAAINHMQWIATLTILLIFGLLYFSLRQTFIRSTNVIKQRNTELNHLVRSLENTYDASLEALSTALDLRDNETEGHSLRVTAYSIKLAKQMGLSEEQLVSMARGALLHDIGKIGIRDDILLKPGPLDGQEWQIMKSHVTIGANMLASIDFLKPSLPIIQYHHERWDGKGYHSGLSGEDIPIGARIFALCDTYDAITSDRPYRKRQSHEEAVQEIKRCRGTQFDPAVVDAFLSISKEEWQALANVSDRREGNFSIKPLLHL
ncbi:MAG TPA: HD-GYP domain-containing protein [Bacillales bacterium]|nr:HD-GYP domain-containing protein [Bacillales bacterium]